MKLFGQFQTRQVNDMELTTTPVNRKRLKDAGTVAITKTKASNTVSLTNNSFNITGSGELFGTFNTTLTGTLTSSGNTVTGSGTNFAGGDAQVIVGDVIQSGSQTRTITAIASETSLTVDVDFDPVLDGKTYAKRTNRGINTARVANSKFMIVEVDPGNGIANRFHTVRVANATSATAANLENKWTFGTISTANVYFANSFVVVGSGTNFNTRFANGDTMIIGTGSNKYYPVRLNKVINATRANTSALWTDSNITGASVYYYTGV